MHILGECIHASMLHLAWRRDEDDRNHVPILGLACLIGIN
jgi:hypothetical protein